MSESQASPVAPAPRARLAYVCGLFGLGLNAQVAFLVPLRAHELGAHFGVIGLIVALNALGPALSAVTLGALIDRFGARRSFVIGTTVTAVVAALFMLPTNYWWFISLQPVCGIAQTYGWVASQSYITGLGDASGRTLRTGHFSFFANAGSMAGPFLAGGMAELVGLRAAFVLPTVYAAAFAIVGLGLDKGTDAVDAGATASRGTGLRSAMSLLGLRGIQVTLLLTFVRIWVNQVFQTFVPVYLVSTGFNPGLAGTVVGAAGFVASGVAPTTGYITRRISAPLVAILGLGCGAVGLVLVPYVSTVPLIYIVSALAGISLGTSLPLLMSLVASAAPPEKRGIALGLRTTANKTAGTAAPVIVGPLISALGMSLGFVVGGLVAAAILLWARVLSTTDARSQVRTDQPAPRNPRGPGTPAQVADERTDGRVPPGHFSGTATRHNFPTR